MSNKIILVNPAPVSYVSFGIATILLSLVNAGILTATSLGVVLAVALPVGGIIQILAGMWDFLRNNMFGAVTSITFGGFWLSFYLIEHASPAVAAEGVGFYLILYGVFSTFLWLASFYLDRTTCYLFTVLEFTFIFLILGQFGVSGMTVAGGYAGIITGLFALYGAGAHVMNHVAEKEVWPLGKPLKKSI